MTATHIYPPAWRIAAAFLIVRGATAVALAGVLELSAGSDGTWGGFWILAKVLVLFGAYPPAVVLGVPAYLISRKWLDATLVNCAFVGGAVAASPWLLLFLLPHGSYANVGGQATVVDGSSTAYGLLVAVELIGQIALVGASAGVLFWLIAVAEIKRMLLDD